LTNANTVTKPNTIVLRVWFAKLYF
jgi:hypothetical protein